MVRPNAVTATSDELIAFMIDIPVASISAGTIKNPPPMPKKPDSVPVARPRPTMADMLAQFTCTSGRPIRDRVFSISMAISQHQQREQRQQPVTVEHFAERPIRQTPR